MARCTERCVFVGCLARVDGRLIGTLSVWPTTRISKLDAGANEEIFRGRLRGIPYEVLEFRGAEFTQRIREDDEVEPRLARRCRVGGYVAAPVGIRAVRPHYA